MNFLLSLLMAATVAQLPQDVFELRSRLETRGFQLQPTMVANRGFHNPDGGSFSLFELATLNGQGEVFFGHFTAADGNTLVADQAPARGALMVELIAWNPAKGMYEFFELIGDGKRGNWFHRGDSADIVRDVKLLHRQADPAKPVFGRTLRCAGCHLNGGPIMKELAAPHNDWWEPAQGLPLGERKPEPRLASILAQRVPPARLAQAVKAGVAKLQRSESYRAAFGGLQEKLRPLFCPLEVNFESDALPLDGPAPAISVPSAWLVDPRLAKRELKASKSDYLAALARAGARFPETSRADADHAWLAPVKAFSDQQAVEDVEPELVADVLAIDYENPVFSSQRCGLLRLVPEQETAGWRDRFAKNLAASNDPAARALLENLVDPARDAAFHEARARDFLEESARKLATPDGVWELFGALARSRNAIAASELSKNPLGKILEPGFRVIFPEVRI